MRKFNRYFWVLLTLLFFADYSYGEKLYMCESCYHGYYDKDTMHWVANSHYVCDLCYQTLVTDKSKLKIYKKWAMGYLDSIGMHIKGHFSARFCVRKEMVFHGREMEMGEKVIHNMSGLYTLVGDDVNVYLLYPVCREEVLYTLSHELTHVWEEENRCMENRTKKEYESFADFIAFKFLEHMGYTETDVENFKQTSFYEEQIQYWNGLGSIKEAIKTYKTRKYKLFD